jgi:probable HAF family extracellular repeat protein
MLRLSSSRLRLAGIIVLLLAGTVCPLPTRAAPAQFYRVTDLGAVFDPSQFEYSPYLGPTGINEQGAVSITIISGAGDDVQSFVWTASGMARVAPPSADWTRITAVNEAGAVAGKLGAIGPDGKVANTSFRAFTGANGKFTVLPGLPGNDAASAVALNDKGLVVGSAATKDNDPSARGTAHAVLWQKGKATDLGTLGGPWSTAFSVANTGKVAGTSALKNGFVHPFVWSKGKLKDLGTLGGSCDWFTRINEKGLVTGACATDPGNKATDPASGEVHAFLWDGKAMHDLGALDGAASSAAYAINAGGDVVGTSIFIVGEGQAEDHAVIWSNGQILDLNTVIDPSAGAFLWAANAIADNGQIVAIGPDANDGQVHGYLLTPA